MKRWFRIGSWSLLAILTVAAAGVGWRTKSEAHRLITNPRGTRKVPSRSPGDFNVPFENVTVTTNDGLHLVGWFMPGDSRATVMFVPGYKDSRSNMVESAALYHRHHYGVLLLSVRGHDFSDGETLSFGHREMADLDAWYRFVAARPDVDPDRIGILGVSMGGSLAIQYASDHTGVKAVVADCAFSSIDDTVETSVKYFTGLPPFPFATLIAFWAGQEAGFTPSEIDAKRWIARISPRPVFLMQGGADRVVSPQSGDRLFQAANEPKELWFDPALGHARFFAERRDEYERRVLGFWNRALPPGNR